MVKELTLQVTAPVENGRQILRVDIPAYPRPRSWRTVLDYDATNLEGVASCIEGYMFNNDLDELRLFEVTGGLSRDCLVGTWSLLKDNEIQSQRIPHILKSLLVINV